MRPGDTLTINGTKYVIDQINGQFPPYIDGSTRFTLRIDPDDNRRWTTTLGAGLTAVECPYCQGTEGPFEVFNPAGNLACKNTSECKKRQLAALRLKSATEILNEPDLDGYDAVMFALVLERHGWKFYPELAE